MIEYTHTTLTVVMRGLEAHDAISIWHALMDCRVKPGNDRREGGAGAIWSHRVGTA